MAIGSELGARRLGLNRRRLARGSRHARPDQLTDFSALPRERTGCCRMKHAGSALFKRDTALQHNFNWARSAHAVPCTAHAALLEANEMLDLKPTAHCICYGASNCDGAGDVRPNVRGKRETAARRQARVIQDKPQQRAGLVTCRRLSA